MSPDIEQPEAVTAAPASASEQSNQSAQAQPQPQQPQPLAVPTEGTAGGAGAEADTDVEILLGTGQPGQEEVDDTDSTECADKEPAGDKPLAQPVLTLRWALNELVDDIYALCVRYVIASHLDKTQIPAAYTRGKGWRIAWLFLAALFTFGLQMTMVTLLWNAASIGNTPMVRPQPEKLWQQVGLAHQLLCKANHTSLAAQIRNMTLGEKCNCSSWWPSAKYSYDTAHRCLSLPPEVMAADKFCDRVTFSVNSSLASYGRGLFTEPEQEQQQQQRRQEHKQRQRQQAGHDPTHFVPEKWDPEPRIDPFFFMIFAYISLAIVVHTEFKQGVWLAYIAAGAVGILPAFYGRRVLAHSKLRIHDHTQVAGSIPWYCKGIIILVPLLQLLGSLAVLATGGVLYLFEQNQTDAVVIIINSVALAFILEVDNKIGHILNLRENWKFPQVQNTGYVQEPEPPHRASQCMQFIADKLQPFNACTQQFIVRLCRKMSNTWQQLWGVVRAQFKARLQPDLLQAPDTLKEGGDTKGKQSRHALVAGYIYMSLVGAMLYAEVCFLAPQSAAQMLSFVVVRFHHDQVPDGGAVFQGVGVTSQLMSNRNLTTTDWFLPNLWYYWSFGGFLDGYYGARNTSTFEWQADPPSGSWIIAAFVLYAMCTFFFVALLCARMLPSCSNRWGAALVATQVVLALLVQAQDSTHKEPCNTRLEGVHQPESIYDEKMLRDCPRNYWWFVVVWAYLVFWVAMFLVWPICSGWRLSAQDETTPSTKRRLSGLGQ